MSALAFHLSPPDVQPDRCLNARHRHAGCTRCVDICPTDAITLTTGVSPLPLLSRDACVGCGACIPVCPTDAFFEALHPETKLINLRDEFPAEETLALACRQRPQPQQTTAPARYVIRHERCLAAFTPAQLLSLSLDGQRDVWLEDDACATCPLSPLHETVVTSVDAANRLLAAFERPQRLHLHTRTITTEKHTVAVLDGAAPELNRRGFFRNLGKLAQQRVEEAADRAPRPLFSPGAPVDQRLPYHTPASLQRLNAHLTSLGENDSSLSDNQLDATGFPWADVQITAEKCSGCQLCARFCPTGALNYLWGDVDDATLFNLTFHPALCLDCNICIAACPENAITVIKNVTTSQLIAPEHQLRMAGYLVPCQRCGALTSPLPGEAPLCYVCREPTMYRQSAQRAHLADLARQLLEKDDTSPPEY